MNLARAELRRLVKRRVTRWMLAFVVAVLGLVVVSVWTSSEKVDEAALQDAEAQARLDYEQVRRDFERFIPEEIAACERAHAAGEAGAEGWPEDCQELARFGPRPEDFPAQNYLPRSFEFRGGFGEMIENFGWVLTLFGFLVGASFVGAEWRSGGMANLLLWRPRRMRVLGTKLVALLTGLAGVVVLLGALWTAAFWLTATYRGVTSTMTAGAWQSFGLTGLRALGLVLVGGAVGFAAASFGRHTATALGAAIAAFVVGYLGVAALVYSSEPRFPDKWLWPNYVQAWMDRSIEFYDYQGCGFDGPFAAPCEPEVFEITWQMAGLGMAGLVVLLLGAALWHIRARDVT